MFRKFAWLLSAMSLFVPFLLSGNAIAAGETYSWKNEQTIEISGGHAQGTITLKKIGNASWKADPWFTYSGGCKILSFGITILSGDGSSGTISANNSTINATEDLCSPEVVNSYNGKTVSIQNVQNRQTNASETADQRQVTVQSSIKTTADAQGGEATNAEALENSKDQVPKNDEITLKAADGKVIKTMTSEDVSTAGGYYGYKTTFTNINPGNYQACSKLAEKCESFEKKSGVAKTVTITGANQPIQVNTTEDQKGESCEDGAGPTGWIICTVLELAGGALNFLDSMITGLLNVDESYLVNPATRQVWSRFRDLAYIILVPALLVMVISTALGFDFISAYTVKKALPRLVIAALFIALSFEITKFMIIAINDIGGGMLGLMSNAGGREINNLEDLFHNTWASGAGVLTLMTGAGVGVGIAAASGVFAGGVFSVIGFLLVAGLFILAVVLLLAFRQVLIIMLAILSPLAILSWIFPGNDKLWKLWKDSFIKLLLLYPVIMLTLGAGRMFGGMVADVQGDAPMVERTLNTIIKLCAYVLPYALIPFLFKSAGGVFANLSGMVNNRNKGLSDRARNWSKNRQQTSSSYVAHQARKGFQTDARARTGRRRAMERAIAGDGRWARGLSSEDRDVLEAEHGQEQLRRQTAQEQLDKQKITASHYDLTRHTATGGPGGGPMSRTDTLKYLQNQALGIHEDEHGVKTKIDVDPNTRRAAIEQLVNQQDVPRLAEIREAARSDQTISTAWNKSVPGSYGALKAMSPDLAKESMVRDMTLYPPTKIGDDAFKVSVDKEAKESFDVVSTDHHASMKPDGWRRWKAIDPTGAEAAYRAVVADTQAASKLANEVHSIF